MIIEELKPLVDPAYRTRTDRDTTGIAGSSLGGLVSLHLAFNHPAVFGKVAALSPSVWWDRKAILRVAVKRVRGMRLVGLIRNDARVKAHAAPAPVAVTQRKTRAMAEADEGGATGP